jgi:hypothetical protein
VIAPLSDLRRLQAVQRLAPAELLEEAEIEATLAAAGRPGGQLRIRVRYRDIATPWFDYLHSSSQELERLVAVSAWRLADVQPDGGVYLATLARR